MAQLLGLTVSGLSRFLNKIYSKDLESSGTITTKDISVTDRTLLPNGLAVGGYNNTAYKLSTHGLVSDDWVRATGSYGLYFESYAGGIHMMDSTYIRTYGNKDFLVDGANLYVGSPSYYWDKTGKINASQLISPIVKTKELTSENISVQDALRAAQFDLQTVTQLGGNGTFYVSPSLQYPNKNTTVQVVQNKDDTTITITDDGIATTADNTKEDEFHVSGIVWKSDAKVKFSGNIGGTVIGTASGTINSVNTTSHTLTITVSGGGVGNVSAATYSATDINHINVMMYNNGSHPIGILITAMGDNNSDYMDVFGGTTDTANVRVGNLTGLPSFNDYTPSGWGLYSDNAFLKGTIVSNSGIIGGLYLSDDALHTKDHIAFNSDTDGFYIGADGKVSIGNSTSYIKYDGENIDISLRSLTIKGTNVETLINNANLSSNYLKYSADTGLIISDNVNANTLGFNAQITSKGINMRNNQAVYSNISSDGFTIYDGKGTDVSNVTAKFSKTAQIGSDATFNTVIDSDSIKLRDGKTVISSFAKDKVTIGPEDSYRTVITPSAYQMVDPVGNAFISYDGDSGVVIRGQSDNSKTTISGSGMNISDLNNNKVFFISCDRLKTIYSEYDCTDISSFSDLTKGFEVEFNNPDALVASASPLYKITGIEFTFNAIGSASESILAEDGTGITTEDGTAIETDSIQYFGVHGTDDTLTYVSQSEQIDSSYYTITNTGYKIGWNKAKCVFTSKGIDYLKSRAKAIIGSKQGSLLSLSLYVAIYYSPKVAFSFGEHNETDASGNVIQLGDHSFSMGYNSIATGKYAYAIGLNSKASATSAITLGSNLIASSEKLSIGKYNKDNTNNIFEIGNGTADVNRKNVFEVDKSGNVTCGTINGISIGTLNCDLTNYWLSKVYPVGSVYISLNSTSPATLFGGTWEQITDRFLFATNHDPGAIGGSAKHTLTVAEMPSHNHTHGEYSANTSDDGGYVPAGSHISSFIVHSDRNYNAGGAFTDRPQGQVNTSFVGYSGGSQAFSIMPPHMNVYMWRRTA